MVKNRVPVSAELAAEIMFCSDRTCCACNERGKAVQIHHIDDDPANNSTDNLAVLCLECHNDTQVKGGFGRTLSKELVTTYRDQWLARVATRRREADERAVTLVTGSKVATQKIQTLPYSEEREKAIRAYANTLPSYRKELEKKHQPEWDSGVTGRMVEASYDYVDDLRGVLIILANFYPPSVFGESDPHEFFSEVISSRYTWHRMHVEPYGPGTGGTIVNTLVAGNVISDVESMIEDMATSLVGYDDDFDWINWSRLWNEVGQRSSETMELLKLIEELGNGKDETLLRKIKKLTNGPGTKSN